MESGLFGNRHKPHRIGSQFSANSNGLNDFGMLDENAGDSLKPAMMRLAPLLDPKTVAYLRGRVKSLQYPPVTTKIWRHICGT